MNRPTLKPNGKCFSAGPCQKRPGWSLSALNDALVGRSHRSDIAKERLYRVVEESRQLLGIPEDYRIAITPGSDTGAFEMAMWSLVGLKPLTVLAWDVFGKDWAHDALHHMRLDQLDCRMGPVGHLPSLENLNPDHDVIFTWNGSSSGIVMDRHDWISAHRTGLTFCDATSAAFAMNLPWDKLDITTYSWQKCLGSEAAHGMIVLSPRAMDRLKTYMPPWPMPKVFRLADQGNIREAVFKGETINTPSMLCVEDVLDVFKWARSIGGLPALVARSEQNLKVVEEWAKTRSHWITFGAQIPTQRSSTSIVLKLCAPEVLARSPADQWDLITRMTKQLDTDGIAFDTRGHIMDEPNIRVWGGPTVESSDMEKLLPWIEWAYHEHVG